MPVAQIVITEVTVLELDALLEYLERHLGGNGVGGEPLFQPLSRRNPWRGAERAAQVRQSWSVDVGEPGWARAWVARTHDDGRILGHADLRARREPFASHRALLGTGVDVAARRQGIASTLVRHVLTWAHSQPRLEWVDLHVLAGNEPAYQLYRRLGFAQTGVIEDMFRIDGDSIADRAMTLRLRSAAKRVDSGQTSTD